MIFHKKNFFWRASIILPIVFFSFFLFIYGAQAVERGWELEQPLPGLAGKISDPAEYFYKLYIFGLSAAGILAVAIIVRAGFLWMTSPAIDTIENAKKMIWGAIAGIILLLSSYLILYTINPELVKLKAPKLKGIEFQESALSGAPPGTGGNILKDGITVKADMKDMVDLKNYGFKTCLSQEDPTPSGYLFSGQYCTSLSMPYIADFLRRVKEAGGDFCITCAGGGLHSNDSHHYYGEAVDIWSKNMPKLFKAVKEAAVPYYPSETDHVHISKTGN